MEFLEEKIIWQERMIKDLEEEQDVLRVQIQIYNFVTQLSYEEYCELMSLNTS